METDKLVDFDHVTDYISREAAKKRIRDSFSDLAHRCEINAILNSIPAADVRPVVRGKWEIDNSYAGPGLMNLRCSVCGEFGGTWRDCTLPSMLYNFCPNCGADCRGGNDGK